MFKHIHVYSWTSLKHSFNACMMSKGEEITIYVNKISSTSVSTSVFLRAQNNIYIRIRFEKIPH